MQELAEADVCYFHKKDVDAVIDACGSVDLLGASHKLQELLGRGVRPERLQRKPDADEVPAPKAAHLVVEACAFRANDPERASEWVGEILGAGLPVDACTLRVLMEAYAARPADGRRRAGAALSAAIARGAAPDARCFQCLFDRCLPAAADDTVRGLLDWLIQETSCDPSPAFVGLMGAKSQTRTPAEAEAWLRRAVEEGVAALTPLYNAVMDAWIKAGDVERATLWLTRMESWAAGECEQAPAPDMQEIAHCGPDTSSYSLLIEAYASRGKEEEVRRWLRRMTSVGSCDEARGYTAVLRAYARLGDLRSMQAWHGEARRRGVGLETEAYSAAVILTARAGTAQQAEDLLYEMRDRNMEPTVAMIGNVLQACSRNGDQRRAERIFQRLVTSGNVSPDSICYTALISAAVKAGDLPGAERWLDAMLARKVAPNVVTYTSLLHAYARSGNVEAAERGMEIMRANRVTPNVVSYSAVMQACVKAGELDRAERWFQEMRVAGVKANAVCYSAVLDACAKEGDWSRAERWLVAMEKDSVAPTVVNFNNVIYACCRGESPLRAEAWLRRLMRKESATLIPPVTVPGSVAPTSKSFTGVAQAYAAVGNFAETERVLSEMREHGIAMDEYSLSVLLTAYTRASPRMCARAEAAVREYVTEGGRLVVHPALALRTCLGSRRCHRFLEELGLEWPGEKQ